MELRIYYGFLVVNSISSFVRILLCVLEFTFIKDFIDFFVVIKFMYLFIVFMISEVFNFFYINVILIVI